MPLSNEQINKLATLFESKQEADHNMAQSLVETLCDTQEDFESLFLRHERHLNGGMPSLFGRSIVWVYGFYAQFEDSPLREWETIDFRGFKLKSLPDYLLTWPNLQRVYWDAGEIHQLEWLDTTGEDASKWVELLEIGSLSELSFSSRVKRLPQFLLKLPKLSKCKWEASELHQLQWLDTTGEDSSKWIELLEIGNLSELSFSGTKLTSLPSSIGGLTGLTRLDLENNQLTTLPENIGNLTKLNTLDLGGNELTTLPKSIGNLTNLKELDLQRNELMTLPESIGNLTNLNTLYLYFNKLTTLPESIGNLTNLNTLSLTNNKLTTLPDWIGNLTNLTYLGLWSNEFTTLPSSIGNLTNLTTLELSENQLTTLPESIGNLTKLTELDLSGIHLTTLPDWLGNLTNLTFLCIFDNPIPESELERIQSLLPNCEIEF